MGREGGGRRRRESTMRGWVRAHLAGAGSGYGDRPREQWVHAYPARVALASSQVWWSNDMELVFQRLEEGFESALKDYNKKQVTRPTKPNKAQNHNCRQTPRC